MKKEYKFKSAKRGPVVPQKGKTRITIFLDNEVIEEFRNRATESGSGYQTMINDALRQYLEKSGKPLNEALIRQVIREELDRAPAH
ncbi:MAG: BrnA antitoxin family protein [Desulfobulbaceae bacterium]|nr:BrnA antitoxin family protein [Desulfobulbaceae bacterium]